MADEKPLRKEIDELLKAIAAKAPAAGESASAPGANLDLLKDVPLNVRIELGRARMKVEDVLRLAAGSVVELDRLVGEPVDVYVNDRLAARGELIVVDDRIAVRVTEVIPGAAAGK